MSPSLPREFDLAMQPSNARWQHGVVTPLNSPQEEAPNCSVGAPATQKAQDKSNVAGAVSTGHFPRPVAQLRSFRQGPLPPTVEPSDDLFSVRTPYTVTEEVTQHQDAGVESSSTSSVQTVTSGTTHPADFPNGVVDPRAGTHLSKTGPPEWSGRAMLGSADYDTQYGSVYSPTFMIGLPFGETIEWCREYPYGR